VNRLLPTGLGSYDPLSNVAHMTGHPVDVRRDASASGSITPSAQAPPPRSPTVELAFTTRLPSGRYVFRYGASLPGYVNRTLANPERRGAHSPRTMRQPMVIGHKKCWSALFP